MGCLGIDRQILCTPKRSNPKAPEAYHKKKSRDTRSPNRHHSHQSPFRSLHNDLNISATPGSCPESPFVSAPSAPSAIRPESLYGVIPSPHQLDFYRGGEEEVTEC